MTDMRRLWILGLLAVGCIGQAKQSRQWDRWEDDDVATVITRVWKSVDGDGSNAASWSDGIVPGTPVDAAATLSIATQPTDGDTITIGSVVYTWKTAITAGARSVLIGISATTARDNLIAAINLAAGLGTEYSAATTKNTDVSAADSTGDDLIVTSLIGGQTGNLIAKATNLNDGTDDWDGGDGFLTGGTGWATTDNIELNDTSSVDWSAGLSTASSVGSFITTPEYSGNIGTTSTPLEIAAATMVLRGSGTVHLDDKPGSSTATIIVDSFNLVDALTLHGGVFDLFCKNGHVEMTAASGIAGSIGTFGVNASIDFLGAGSGPSFVYCVAGEILLERGGGAGTVSQSIWIVAGGTLRHKGLWEKGSNLSVPVFVVTAGRLIREGDDTALTDSRQMKLLGGIMDIAQSEDPVDNQLASVIGPDATFITSAAIQLPDSVISLTDLRKDYP